MNSDQEKAKTIADVMLAFAAGKPIQARIRDRSEGYWGAVVGPSWNWHDYEYRVKPPEPRTIWIVFSKDGQFVAMRATKEEASKDAEFYNKFYTGSYTYAPFKEVM